MTTLRDAFDRREPNNLNAIRLFLAVAVIYAHSFPLSVIGGGDPLAVLTMGQKSVGACAVDLFFFLSGMLITSSWLRAKSMNEYFRHRFLRIYPAYIVAVCLSALVAWSVCADFRHAVDLTRWIKTCIKDCLSLSSGSLMHPGIFSKNPVPGAVNGSLWTISYEFECYILLAIIGLFSLLKRRQLILFVAVFVYFLYAREIGLGNDVSPQAKRFLLHFLLGMCAWIWRDRLPVSRVGAVIVIVAGGILARLQPAGFAISFPLIGGYVSVVAGFAFKIPLMGWTKKTDISYGVYLYAFPVQQLIALNASLRIPFLSFVIATPVALGLGWLSWNFVEQRFLQLKTRRFSDFDPALEPAGPNGYRPIPSID